MAEYLPVFKPGQAITLKASATITGGQLLVVTGAGTVGPAGANAVNWIGVASNDAATNDNVTVYADGVQSVTTSGTVNAGDLVVSAAAGTVSTLAAVTTPTAADVTNSRAIVGVALTTATTGLKVRVKFAR
jgi:hypothetical protein